VHKAIRIVVAEAIEIDKKINKEIDKKINKKIDNKIETD
jgi:ribosomal protein L31E